MRVLELAAFDQEQAGSFLPLLAAIGQEGARRGWGVDVVLPESAQDLAWVADIERSGAEIHFLAKRGRQGVASAIERVVDRGKGPIVLHTHFTDFDIAAAMMARRRRDALCVWHVHTALHRSPVALARNVAKFGVVGRMVDRMLCPSEAILDEVRRRLAPVDKLSVFPSAIALEQYPQIDIEGRRRARRELGLPIGAEILLHFGWHWELKGGDLLLDTLVEARRASPAAELIALTRDTPDARAAVARRGLERSVVLLPPVPDVRQLYAVADVLIASSEREGMPFTMVESLASGTPVVATDIPGHAYIGQEVASCRLAVADGAAMAAAVAETLDRPDGQAAEEAEQAQRWLEDNLSVRSACRQLADLFAERATHV